MKDLISCAIARDDLLHWPESGTASAAAWKDAESGILLLKLEKAPSVNYLYQTSAAQDSGISWNSSLIFCGVYELQIRRLFLTRDSLSAFMHGRTPLLAETGASMLEAITGRINRRVEAIIANDRRNLPVQELTGSRVMRDLQYYQEHGARGEALQRLFNGREPDGQFHSGYTLEHLPEAAFMAWLQDPERFIQAEAEAYIKTNQEKFLLQFLENDALLAEYQTLVQDTGNPVHRMKAITDAISTSGAKTVTVTVQKAGEELTFKTGTSCLRGYRNSYSTSNIPAADRREFERLFGRHAEYGPEDITKITYGRNTIYEAPPAQAEELAEGMELGGIRFG